jgi:HK97 family phage major capsid protein
MPEPTAVELIQEIGEKFETFKEKVDKEIKLVKEADHVPAELKEQIGRIETELQGLEKQKERLDVIETAAKRGNLGGQTKADEAKEASNEYSELVQKYMRRGDEGKGGIDAKDAQRIEELQKTLGEAKLLSIQINPDGGYWVSPDQTGRIAERIFETSPMRQVASVQPISTDKLEGVYDDDEAGSEWVGETDLPTDETTPKTKKWSISVHEHATRPKATQQLLEDANINVEQWLANKVTRKFARTENLAFVSGDGAGKPRGFLDLPEAADLEDFERGAIGTLESINNGAIVFEDLIALQTALKSEYEVSSTWSMNRRAKGEIRKLKDLEGQFLWQPLNQEGMANMLLGRPIVMFEDMPDIANGTKPIAIADWAETYQIVDRLGISVLRDPFTAKPFVEFYTRKRVGGDVVQQDSIKILKINAP